MSVIQLINVDGDTPDTPPEIREEEEVPVEVAPPLKRGRGRPPGAKNKKKPVPEESAPPRPGASDTCPPEEA